MGGRDRLAADPTVRDSPLSLPVPDAWQEPLHMFERYLWARGTSPSTVGTWIEQLRNFARAHPTVGPFEITLDDIYEWMASKRWARETRRGRKSTLRTFYRWAMDTERVSVDPTRKLPKVTAGDPVARPATDAEYRRALDRSTDERWTLALRLAAELGMRRAEVARVHSTDVLRAPDGAVTLTVHGKGGKVRRIPVPGDIAAMLGARGDGYAFPGQIVEKHAHARGDGHLSARYLGKRIGELLPPDVTMHALRHRFATKAYNIDRDVFTVQRLLGHASPATTQRYVQLSDARMRALVDAVSGFA